MAYTFTWDGAAEQNWDTDHWGRNGAAPVYPGDTGTGDDSTIIIETAPGLASPYTGPAASLTALHYRNHQWQPGEDADSTNIVLAAGGSLEISGYGGWYGDAGLTDGATFGDFSYNFGTVGDYAAFSDGAINVGVAGAYAAFVDTSNNSGQVGDHAVLDDGASNGGAVGDHATLRGEAWNGIMIGDHALFEESALNTGQVGGFSTWRDSATNSMTGNIGASATIDVDGVQSGSWDDPVYIAGTVEFDEYTGGPDGLAMVFLNSEASVNIPWMGVHFSVSATLPPAETDVKAGTAYDGGHKTGTYDPITGRYTDPGAANVRHGTVYQFAGESRDGACHVPAAGSVTCGAPVDATVGTAVLTPQNVAAALDLVSIAPPEAGANSALWSFREMLVMIGRLFFRGSRETAAAREILADDGETVLSTQAVSDDGTTQTLGAANAE